MKTKLILGSLVAFAGIANAQTWGGSGTTTGDTYRTGNVGIGTNAPTHPLEVIAGATGGNGIKITQNYINAGAHSAILHLDNSGNTNGKRWALMSTGPGDAVGAGNFSIYDWWGPSGFFGVDRFLIEGSTGNVGIGTTTPASGTRVHAVSTLVGVRGDASDPNGIGVQGDGSTGVFGEGVYGTDGVGDLIGARGSSYGSGDQGLRMGMRGGAGGAATNYGGYFQVSGSPANVTSFGVYSEAFNPTLGGVNYGVYSTVSGNNNLGTGPNYAGYFDGDVVTAGGFYFYSDSRLKKDISKMNNSLQLIKQLNPVNYHFDREGNPNLALPTEKQYGFLSQEVKELLPDLAKTVIHPAKLDDAGKEIYPSREVLGLNYNGFIALLTRGIQEQQQVIEAQEKVNAEQQKQIEQQLSSIADLQMQVNALKKSGTATGIDHELGASGFGMDQNIPNPFNGETKVRFSLPASVNSAFMVVYDLNGKQLASFPITERGTSSVTLTSEKLAAGMYIYSIVADNKIVDSKRMVVSEK